MLTVILITFVIVAIYFKITAKKRRKEIFYPAIMKLINSGAPYLEMDEVYFAAAVEFAKEHGAELPPGKPKFYIEQVNFYMELQGSILHVFFHKLPNDGTLLVVPPNTKMNKNFSYIEVIKNYDLETIAAVMSIIVRAKFSRDPAQRIGQVEQFMREEAEAMMIAGGYPAQVAKTLFDDESYYMGAMSEDAEYPVDYPGGPQQPLLKMTMDFMHETGRESDLPTRFRCAVVKNVSLIESAALFTAMAPDKCNKQKVVELKKQIDKADKILGELLSQYEKYFSQFIR